MSNIKFSPDLFIGSQELNRFQRFLTDEGFTRNLLQNTVSFGLVQLDNDFENFKVEQGTNVGTIRYSNGFAYDSNGNFITTVARDNISVPNDNQWYWLKISYQSTNSEVGIVSIDANGNLSGTGTFFTEVLRGSSDSASRIEFDSTINTGEYDVLEVISDTSAVLQGEFINETGLTYSVIGSFTPTVVVPDASKNIFNYDSASIVFELETVANTPPTLVQNREFVIARVKRDGNSLIIQDKRSSIFRTKIGFDFFDVDEEQNPVIGVESIKWQGANSTRIDNIVYLSWSFRSDNFTIDSNTNLVTINGGQGGKFRSTADFTNGDFDGWRLYLTAANKYATIRTSTSVGSQINLLLDVLDPLDFVAQQLIITPDVEVVEVAVIPQTSANNEENPAYKTFSFPVKRNFVRLPLQVFESPTAQYQIQYRYKNNFTYTNFSNIPNDTVGYFDENSFLTTGELDPVSANRTQIPVSNGIITLTINPNAFSEFVNRIDLGDILSTSRRELDNVNPIVNIEVGVDAQNLIYEGSITFSTNHFINLSTDGARAGNKFFFKMENDVTLNGNIFQFVQGYQNPGNVGTVLLDLDSFWVGEARDANLYIICIFDGTNWEVQPIASVTSDLLGGVLQGALLANGSVAATAPLRYSSTFNLADGDPTNTIAHLQYVLDQISALRGNAPTALNTLQELANALGNDPTFSQAVFTALDTKLNISALINSFTSTSTTRPPTANALRNVHTRTNQSDLFVTQDATVNMSSEVVAVGAGTARNYPSISIAPSVFGSSSYNYSIILIGSFTMRSQGGNDTDIIGQIQISTNGGASYSTVASVEQRSFDQGSTVFPVIVGKTNVLSSQTNVLARVRAVINQVGGEGTNVLLSTNASLNAFAVNAYQ